MYACDRFGIEDIRECDCGPEAILPRSNCCGGDIIRSRPSDLWASPEKAETPTSPRNGQPRDRLRAGEPILQRVRPGVPMSGHAQPRGGSPQAVGSMNLAGEVGALARANPRPQLLVRSREGNPDAHSRPGMPPAPNSLQVPTSTCGRMATCLGLLQTSAKNTGSV